jgi:glucose-6-phosphate isomerase
MLHQDLLGFFHSKVGARGLHQIDLERALFKMDKTLVRLRDNFTQGMYPFLGVVLNEADMPLWEPHALRFREEFETTLILGTGGSSLGGQTLAALNDEGTGFHTGQSRLIFLENVDPHTFNKIIRTIKLEKTGIVAISKSGNTAETIAQLLSCEKVWKEKGLSHLFQRNTLLITEPKPSPLHHFGQSLGLVTLDHDPYVGGRFSIFSLVGLFPAVVAGLNARKVRTGAARVFESILHKRAIDLPQAIGAALLYALMTERGATQTIVMPYVDRLAPLGLWFRQLWAESLGKEGKGMTPIRAMGTVDQHSQLQLYLEGPQDKIFTLLGMEGYEDAEKGPVLSSTDLELSYLQGHTLADLIMAEERATFQTLLHHGCPTRRITFDRLDEEVMGALLMHFMIETLLMGFMMGVDPLTQPAVEESKRLTRQYLSESRGPLK